VLWFQKSFDKQKSMRFGQRDFGGSSQATFTYGTGERVIKAQPRTKPQSQRGAGERGKGQMDGLDLYDVAKPYSEKAHEQEGGGE